MRLLLVYQDARLPSSRIRVLQMQPHLEALGCRCECVAYPSRLRDLRALVERAGDFDVVLLQKKLPAFADAFLWKSCAAPIVYDFDDAVTLRSGGSASFRVSPTRRRRFHRLRGYVSGFIAGNRWLAALCQEAGLPVLVAPSPVPFPVPDRSSGPENPRPVLGWIGARGNLASLTLVAPALRALSRRRDFVLRVICDGSLPLHGVPVERVPWRLESQDRELARLDIGLMPLPDTPWSRGKCAYKLLQYMAAGVPAVASAVGMNQELIEHERNGLLARSDEAWEAALGRLIDDPLLRQRLGAGGRATVRDGFTYEVTARRWRDFFAGVSCRAPSGSSCPELRPPPRSPPPGSAETSSAP